MRKIIFLLITLVNFLILPTVLADVVIISANSTSLVQPEEGLDIELIDANVSISCHRKYLYSEFKIKSDENDDVDVIMYFKAESKYGTTFPYGEANIKFDGEWVDPYHLTVGNKDYIAFNATLTPDEIKIVEVGISIELPFYYYLDSLQYYSKAEHEIIEIEGYCDAEFNDDYPVEEVDVEKEPWQKESWKKYVWEYSNIDTDDPDVLDTLVITQGDKCKYDSECEDDCAYTIDTCEGEPKDCVHTRTSGECVDNDDCCPTNCNACNDKECFWVCGNGICNTMDYRICPEDCVDGESYGDIEDYRKDHCETTTTTTTTTTTSTTTTTETTTMTTKPEETKKTNTLARIYQSIIIFFRTLVRKWYRIFD